jgi:hypothetical protein
MNGNDDLSNAKSGAPTNPERNGHPFQQARAAITEEMLLAYLEGKLTNDEQHAIEEQLSEEGMESDAMEGLQQIGAKAAKASAKRVKKNLIGALKTRNGKKLKNSNNALITWFAVAVVLLLCTVAYLLIHLIAPHY